MAATFETVIALLQMFQKLEDIAEVRMGYSFRRRLEARSDGAVAVVQLKDLVPGQSLVTATLARVDACVHEGQLLRQGDLLFRSRGECHRCIRVDIPLPPTILAGPMLLVRPHPALVDSEYLAWFVNHPESQRRLTADAEGATTKMITRASLADLPVALPVREAQQRVAGIARLITEEATLMMARAALQRQLSDSLLLKTLMEQSP